MNQRKRKTIINNIESINMEIDYDKLARAIAKALNDNEVISNTNSKYRSILMRFSNGCIYLIGLALSGVCIYKIWDNCSLNQVTIIKAIIFTVLFAFMGIYFFLCQQETLGDKDKDSREHFNTNISFIALIVSLIALLKGVA